MNEYQKEYLITLSPNGLSHWLDSKRLNLAGGALFTKNNSWLSKTICSVTKKYSRLKEFIPSHVGSIIMLDGILYVFNMIPPEAYVQRLDEYLNTTQDDFVIVLRNFELDISKFSSNLFARIGEKYGYFSALQCAFKNIDWVPNKKEHCSEIHLLELQKQGYFKDVIADDMTPVEDYEKLITEKIKSENTFIKEKV